MDINKICPGCMKEVQNKENISSCPHCGYSFTDVNVSSHQLRPYTILAGKYMVGRVIGEGGFGITYLGYDLNLEIAVAIKEFYPNGFVTRESATTTNLTIFAGNNAKDIEKWRDNFIKEARSLARFSNLNGIVEVRDFFNENSTAYIVMEYIDGVTLKSYLKQCGGKIPVDQVFAMMEPVINSLAKVHETGIIHRDISPDNIMITNTGSMKLLDFGAARDISASGEKSLSVMLKPGYAPEEQYRTRGNQGPWSDVYALCATIYKCITGITPIESMERLRNDYIKMPSELGIAIDSAKEQALIRGMAVIAEERIQDMKQLHEAFYEGVIPATVASQRPQPQMQSFSQPQTQTTASDVTVPMMNVQNTVPVQNTTMTGVQMTQYMQSNSNTTQQTQTGGLSSNSKKILSIILAGAAGLLCVVLAIVLIVNLNGGKKDSDTSETKVEEVSSEENKQSTEETKKDDEVTTKAVEYTDEDRAYMDQLCNRINECASIYDYQNLADDLCSFVESKGQITEAMPQINQITSAYYENAYEHYRTMMEASKSLPVYAEIKLTCDKLVDHFKRLRNIGLEPVDYNNAQSLKEEYAANYKRAWADEFDAIATDNIRNSASHAISRSTIWSCVSTLDNQDEDYQDFIESIRSSEDPLGMRYRVGLVLHVDELTQSLSGRDAGDIINAYMEETGYNPLMVSMMADRAGNDRAWAWLGNIDTILSRYSVQGYENKKFSQLNDLEKRNYIYYLINYPNALNEIRTYMSQNYSY